MTLCYGFRTSKMLFKIVRRYKVTYYYSRPALDGTITYYGHRHFFSCYDEKNLRIVFNSFTKNNYYIYLKNTNDDYHFLKKHYNVVTLSSDTGPNLECKFLDNPGLSNNQTIEEVSASLVSVMMKKNPDLIKNIKNLNLLKSQLTNELEKRLKQKDKISIEKYLDNSRKYLNSFKNYEAHQDDITLEALVEKHSSLSRYPSSYLKREGTLLIEKYKESEGIYFDKIDNVLRNLSRQLRDNIEKARIKDKFVFDHSLAKIKALFSLPDELINDEEFVKAYDIFLNNLKINDSSEKSLKEYLNNILSDYQTEKTFLKVFNTSEKILDIDNKKIRHFEMMKRLESTDEESDIEFKLYLRVKEEYEKFIYYRGTKIRPNILKLESLISYIDKLKTALLSSKFLVEEDGVYHFDKQYLTEFGNCLRNI